MPITQLDTENADRDLTSEVAVLTDTPDASNPTVCMAYVAMGDGAKDLDGSGGAFEFRVTVGGQTVQPGAQEITFGEQGRAAIQSAPFTVPANAEVVVYVLSPNAADTDVDVTAYLYDVAANPTAVSGAVGSVTGAVGSVTGNVGGNVVGTVASVVGAVGSVTGNVGGNVDGSVASVVGAVGSVTGNVGGNLVGTIGGLTAAALANLFDTDSGKVYADAVDGSPVKEIVSNVTAEGVGDWTSAEKSQLRQALGITGTTAATTGEGTIEAKTNLIGSVSVEVSAPVASDGTVTIIEGDEYAAADARQLSFALTASDWANLDATSTWAFRVMTRSDYDTTGGTGSEIGTVAATVADGTLTVTVTLTEDETDALSPVPPADRLNYVYQLVGTPAATGAGPQTVALGAMTVTRKVPT